MSTERSPLVTKVVDRVQSDGRIVAAWLENAREDVELRVEVHVALRESDFAEFYAARREWLTPFSPVVVRDLEGPWPGCLAFTRDGLLILAVETWGSVPERPRRGVRILLDRTGRLRERLRPWTSPERVDFAMLDRLAVDVWLNLWAAEVLHERDAGSYLDAVAAAVRAYLAFVAACQGEGPGIMAWSGALAEVAGLDEHILDLSPRALARTVAHLMSTRARALAESRGWKYPEGLAEIACRSMAGNGDPL